MVLDEGAHTIADIIGMLLPPFSVLVHRRRFKYPNSHFIFNPPPYAVRGLCLSFRQ
jgi:hypothetical protein